MKRKQSSKGLRQEEEKIGDQGNYTGVACKDNGDERVKRLALDIVSGRTL